MLLDYGHITVPENWFVAERSAPGFSRVYYVQGGEVVYRDEHKQQRLRHQRVYLFPSATPFELRQNPKNPLVCTFLHLDVFPLLVRELLELSAESGSFLERLFQLLADAVAGESPRVVAGIGEVFLQYCQDRDILKTPKLEISAPLLYIAEHIRQGPITVRELSELSGYNPQYFIRLFRQSVGLTPHQYITNYRMSESIKLLRQGGYPVGEVAELVGYPDGKAFSRAFREKYGVTPTQYRKLDLTRP